MSSEDLKLPASLQKLYDALEGDSTFETGYLPVDVAGLHAAVYGETEIEDVRHQQQRLGTYVTKLNRRLRGHKLAVKPGDRKYTYVLTSL
jgi:hypothetical protein